MSGKMNRRNEVSLTALFRQRWLEADGEYIPVATGADIGQELLKFIRDNGIKTVALGGSPLTPAAGDILSGRVEILTDFGRNKYDPDCAKGLCSRADAGISGVDALISATGTLVAASRSHGDRLVSSLPPIHLVIANEAPVFKDLDSFLAVAPSDLSFSFITGPSRTADIEKRLVLGIHGPIRVVVWGSEV